MEQTTSCGVVSGLFRVKLDEQRNITNTFKTRYNKSVVSSWTYAPNQSVFNPYDFPPSLLGCPAGRKCE